MKARYTVVFTSCASVCRMITGDETIVHRLNTQILLFPVIIKVPMKHRLKQLPLARMLLCFFYLLMTRDEHRQADSGAGPLTNDPAH